MKPAFESVSASANASFVVRKFEEKSFSAPYHFHPEYELTLILTGTGKRYVGTNMNDYFSGDLVLLGANLPHCWKTENSSAENSVSVVIHFDKDFMGKNFFYKPETQMILQLLDKSNCGLHFTGNTVFAAKLITTLLHENDSLKKLILLLEILHHLTALNSYNILDSQSFNSELSPAEKQRMNAVIAYIVENFQNTILLKDAAATANLTSHAFCKYFKRVTRKTFMEAVNDYRIDFAVKQLIHTEKPVAEIGFDSGFNDISNFYRTFKERMKLSPLSYRNTFIRELA